MKHFRPMFFLACAIVICCSCLHAMGESESAMTEDMPAYGQDDRFSQAYAKEQDMVYSIQSKLDTYQQDLVKYIYSPDWTYQTDAYRIEIVEILADNYQAYANIKFTSLSADAVVRPFFCAEDGRYNIAPEECEKEVYFFEYVFYPFNRPPRVSDSSVGISLSGMEMNDINTWSYSGTANRYRYNDREITFVFEMKIGNYENDELVVKSITCEISCPVLPVIDLCYFESAQCIGPAFYRTNTNEPEFVIVLTPLDMYCRRYSASSIIPEEECGYWIIKIEGEEMNWLSSSTKYTAIPEDISLVLYSDRMLSKTVGQWRLQRYGDCLVPIE